MFKVPEKFRLKNGAMGSTNQDGNNGVFFVRTLKFNRTVNCVLNCVASDGGGWEHVSVSINNRCPTWEEMSYIKSLFWDDEDFVVQLHPPKSEWINNHPYCLHLWRKAGSNDFCEKPPSIMVGV